MTGTTGGRGLPTSSSSGAGWPPAHQQGHFMIKPDLRWILLLGCLLLAPSVSAAGPQVIKLSPSALRGLPRTSVRVQSHGSSGEASYEGVSLGDAARKFGAPAGEAIRGAKVSVVVVVKAADGYQAVFALPELDPAFTRKVVLLADRRNGEPLSTKEGPYRLIVPDEARQARWVRQVISLEIRELN